METLLPPPRSLGRTRRVMEKASRMFDIPFSDDDINIIRELMIWIRDFDTDIDIGYMHDTDSQPTRLTGDDMYDNNIDAKVARAIDHWLESDFLSESYPNLAGAMTDEVRIIAHRLFGRINRHIKSTDSAYRYMVLRQEEGRRCAEMIIACFTPETRNHPNFPDMAECIQILGRAATLYDSLLDARHDYSNGELNVRLKPRDYISMLGQIASCMYELKPYGRAKIASGFVTTIHQSILYERSKAQG